MVGALPFAGGHRDDCPVVGANGIASKTRVAWGPLRRREKKRKKEEKKQVLFLFSFLFLLFFLSRILCFVV
jgi:hypothetical protein